MPASTPSQYSAGKFAIELEDVSVGYASTVEGGEPVGDAVSHAPDASGLVKKSLANVHYAPIRIAVGLGMGKELAEWVTAFTARKADVKNGAIVFLDYGGQVRSRLAWTKGRIIEVRFPGPDSTDHGAGEIVIIIQPEFTRLTAGGGGRVSLGGKTQKAWLLSNFRIAIDGIPNDSGYVSRMEAMVVRQSLVADPIGDLRAFDAKLGPQEVSDVVLTVAEAHSGEFAQWAETFLVQGNSGDQDERNGTLEFLSPSMEVLARLSLRHLGILRVARVRVESGNSVIARVTVQMFCEEVLFSPASVAAEQPAQPPVATTPARLSIPRDLPRPAAASRSGAIAARLLASDAATGAGSAPERQDGFALGQAWASEQATMEEFAGLAQVADPDWTAIALPRGHSLIGALSAAGVLPAGENGPIDLQRGPLVDGLVDGIGRIADQIDSAAEMGEMESLRLQMMMDRRSKMLQALSNIMKKQSDTAAAIVGNLK